MLDCRRRFFQVALSSAKVAPNGWRLGVRAGERKSSDGRQTFKFPQNFLRAYTPPDAKPFVGCQCILPFFPKYF